jgi:DNA-binding NarL/FixJ family response regulator
MQPYKLLLVEDEAIISMSIEETLNGLGYNNIKTAFDAPTASEYLANEKFDVVLMDINLGSDKDGIDVMNEIKKHIDIPLVYITGNSDAITVNKAKYSEPDGFIVKPFSETDLKITLELVLHKAKSRLRKKNRLNTNFEFSFEENKNELVIRLGAKGEIYYVNSYIKKLTNKPPVFYTDKKIEESDFDPFFSSTLTNILTEVKNANRHLFYCNVKNPKLGERVMEIVVTPDHFANNAFGSYLLKFNDVTDRYAAKSETAKQKTLAELITEEPEIENKIKNKLHFEKVITARETEILSNIVKGLSNKDIANLFNISEKTVSVHRTHIMKKLNAKNAAHLVKIAINNRFSLKTTLKKKAKLPVKKKRKPKKKPKKKRVKKSAKRTVNLP